MSDCRGRARAISRKTVRPPTPLSKTPIGLAAVSVRDNRPPRFALDVVLLDLLVEIRPRRIDGLGGLRHVPAVLAQLGHDERLLRLVLELLHRGEAHGAGAD